MKCKPLPTPGRHEPDDEYVETESCPKKKSHSDHYWSLAGHEHEDGYWSCERYCEGGETS